MIYWRIINYFYVGNSDQRSHFYAVLQTKSLHLIAILAVIGNTSNGNCSLRLIFKVAVLSHFRKADNFSLLESQLQTYAKLYVCRCPAKWILTSKLTCGWGDFLNFKSSSNLMSQDFNFALKYYQNVFTMNSKFKLSSL